MAGQSLTEEKFFVRGVVYQTRGTIDPISDDCVSQLEHDVPLFRELGVNTLFVYSIDNTKAHAKAMRLLEEAKIYVLTMVSTPKNSINRQHLYDSYNPTTIASFFATVDTMAVYRNSLGLAAASHIVNNDDTISATPVIKAVVRDLKRYMKLKNELCHQRILPIYYDADSTGARDRVVLDYLSSGEVESSIDFWTCKNYSSFVDPSAPQCCYDDLVEQLGDVNLPIFFSEYSDSKHQPRPWHETKALYSPRTSQVFSGGCAYEFWQGANGFGLVEMLGHNSDTRWASVREAKVRADDETKVLEKRESNEGFLLIYHDFANLKTSLRETRGLKSDWDQEYLHREKVKTGNNGHAPRSWPWEPVFHEPKSCVDWEQTRKLMTI